ncbi:MAG: hypothetical protein KAT28_05080 [Candidatus Aenigmarchaeota archaeon]|nr:hypothetical protein [Candidatus Aenigmarchaeota archaeon]
MSDRKNCLKSAMVNSLKNKGQVNIPFTISLFVFIGLTVYLISSIIGYHPSHSEAIKSDILYSKAYSISELLIKDKGYPGNWEENNFRRVGLASEPYLLNSSKIAELEKICNSTNITNIRKLRESFGLMDENLNVEIKYLNGTGIGGCFPGSKIAGRSAYVKRICVLNDELAEVVVYVG